MLLNYMVKELVQKKARQQKNLEIMYSLIVYLKLSFIPVEKIACRYLETLHKITFQLDNHVKILYATGVIQLLKLQ